MASLEDETVVSSSQPPVHDRTIKLADTSISLDDPALATIPYFATLKATPCGQKMDITQLQAITKEEFDMYLQARSGDVKSVEVIVPALTLANVFLDTVGAAVILAHPTTHLHALTLLEPLWMWRAQNTIYADLPEWTALLERAYQRLQLDFSAETVSGWPVNLWRALLEDPKLPAITRLEFALVRLKQEPTLRVDTPMGQGVTDLIQVAYATKGAKLPILTRYLLQLGRTEWLGAAVAASTGLAEPTTWQDPEGYRVIDVTSFDIKQLSFGEPTPKYAPNTQGNSARYTAVDMLYGGEKKWLLRLPDCKMKWVQMEDKQILGTLSYDRKSPAWAIVKTCLDSINGAIRKVVPEIAPRGLDLDHYRLYNYKEYGNYGYISLKRRPNMCVYDDLTGNPLSTLPMKWSTAKAPLIGSYLFCNEQMVACPHYLHQTYVVPA